MGEQPLFSCKAHVFQLEPEMKKSWIALSTTAVNVQIFHDPIKNIYRIVSVEGTKALINSIVTPKMTFTKTSQKFGQWIDFKLNLVYGLGFSNDVELNKFVDKFKEIKELTRGGPILRPHERSNSCEITNVNRINPVSDSANEANDFQLKYENERLKMVLAQNSSNSRRIEEELLALKTSNTRLVAALQESHTNIEEWKKQLQYYKDECTRLRNANGQNSSMNKVTSSTSSNNNFSSPTPPQHDLNESDEVSSSTNSYQNRGSPANKKTKQDLIKLTESFDKKFRELNDIREQIRQLALDMC